LTVQEAPWRTPLATGFVEGGMELGYENRDINSEFQTGFMIVQGTIRRGSRSSTSKAFLRPIRLRPNLHVAIHAHVTKVHVDPIHRRAWGVTVFHYGKPQIIRASREIILSAGAVNSPQILLLSGIGPKEHLQQVGIPVVQVMTNLYAVVKRLQRFNFFLFLQDLPVGENLQDHIGFGGLVFTLDQPVSLAQPRSETIPSIVRYLVHGSGPLTAIPGGETVAFVHTKYGTKKRLMKQTHLFETLKLVYNDFRFSNVSNDWPDIQFHMVPGSISSDGEGQLRRAQGKTEILPPKTYYKLKL